MNIINFRSKYAQALFSLLLSFFLVISCFSTAYAFEADDFCKVNESSVDGSSSDYGLNASSTISLNDYSGSANTFAYNSAEDIVAKMSLKQKIEQMIMPCIRQWQTSEQSEPSNFVAMNPEVQAFLQNHNLAGLCLFAQNSDNTEQTTRLCYDIQQASASGNNLPYLLSIDQEGGGVMRLKSGTLYENAMAVSATYNSNNAFDVSREIAEETKAVGMNLDFAPDVDVNTNPNNPIIGLRSFSDIPSFVVDFAKMFILGIDSEEIASTIKHFPGHGDTSTDSHTGLPMVDKSREELDKVELFPFRELISQDLVDCLMTAHIQFPQVETSTYTSIKTGEDVYLPATLSKVFLNDILRNEYKYDGVIATDALEMDAITQHFKREDTARLAINAGVDILLMPVALTSNNSIKDFDNYVLSIENMVNNNLIDVNRINESAIRIVQLKIDKKIIGNTDTRTIEQKIDDANKIVGCSDHKKTELQVGNEAVTTLKNIDSTLPINSENQKFSIITCRDTSKTVIEKAISDLKSQSLISQNCSFDIVGIQKGGDNSNTAALESVKNSDEVICFTNTTSTANLKPSVESNLHQKDNINFSSHSSEDDYLSNSSSLNNTNVSIISPAGIIDNVIETAHLQNKKVVSVSMSLPYDVARFTKADAIMAGYAGSVGLTNSSGQVINGSIMYRAVLDIIFGVSQPNGLLPLDIPIIKSDYTYSETELAFHRGDGLTSFNSLSHIIVSSLPNKIIYKVGESFDSTGMEVLAFYSDGSSKLINDYSVSPSVFTLAGQQVVNISYIDKQSGNSFFTQISVIVDEPSLAPSSYDQQNINEVSSGSNSDLYSTCPSSTSDALLPFYILLFLTISLCVVILFIKKMR